MDIDRFKELCFFPDPVMGPDEHYLPVTEMYMALKQTAAIVHPRFRERNSKCVGIEQHVRNAGVVVQRNEYNKWGLLLSKRKLSAKERAQLQGIIQDISYSCGATLDDLMMLESLVGIGIKNHSCCGSTEKLYYPVYGYNDPIRIHCGSSANLKSSEVFYPYCCECASSERINKTSVFP